MRLVIFSGLGPLVGLIPFHLWTWATTNIGYPLWPWDVWLMVFGAYVVGFIPAWFTGAADWLLSSRVDGWRRVLATACAGYLITGLISLLSALPHNPKLSQVLAFGLAGVLPAAVCAWVSGRLDAWLRVMPDGK